jgi:hypothetical protein
MAEGREAVDFHQLDCKKSRAQPLDPSHWRPKSKGRRSPKFVHGNTSWWRRRTLEGSLGRTWMETQTMVERPSIFFSHILKKIEIDKILVVRLKGLFWIWNKMRCSGEMIWVWTLDLTFKSFTLCPAKGFNTCVLLTTLFQPNSLNSRQTLAIQSHGLSTWTTIAWSGPSPSHA